VWGLAATPVTARGRMVEAATGEPLIIGAVTICTGDIVVADASGVAVIPASHADEVVGAAERIRDRERAMADRLREGITPNLVLGAGYEELLRFTKT
jgi:4-hydroxy-4-methyl-2-oxoglutarate aldolase